MERRGSTTPIERVCFNFIRRCNMHCPFCFVPFTGAEIKQHTCLSIVDRARELGASVITFCGGDPFDCSFIGELIERAAEVGLEVHVDTNGLGLRPHHYGLLDELVSLLALPLDGATAAANALMRHHSMHFDILTRHLRELRSHRVRLKINTVVARPNVTEIPALADLLEEYRVDIWSLYQFWPQHRAVRHSPEFYLDIDSFETMAAVTCARPLQFRVEASTQDSRHGTYFFVGHEGTIYVNSPRDPSRYLWLGSIFDDAAIERWRDIASSSVRGAVRERYSSLSIQSTECRTDGGLSNERSLHEVQSLHCLSERCSP